MTRRSLPLENTAALARIVADINRLTREVGRLAEVHDVVAAHGRAIDDLADLVDRLATRPRGIHGRSGSDVPPADYILRSDGLHPAHDGARGGAGRDSEGGDADDEQMSSGAWLVISDPALAVQRLEELSVWVPAVWQPYLLTHTPGCWPWHPAVVAELLVVQDLWDEAVHDEAPGALAAWHDRWRPSAARRVERLMAGCERAEGHHKISGREHTYDTAYLDELAVWWATTHGTDPTQWPPGISREGSKW